MPARSGQSAHHAPAAEVIAKVGSLHHDEDDHGHGKANCLDFCEKSSIGAPTLKLADDSSTSTPWPVLAPSCSLAYESWEPSRGWLPVESVHAVCAAANSAASNARCVGCGSISQPKLAGLTGGRFDAPEV
jgi:hypothetical protein